MGYTTASTEWPSIAVPTPVKQLVDTFFSLLDNDNKGVGDRLAGEIFAADGLIDAHSRAEGTEAIRKSRDHAWNVIKTRHHEILKVYASSADGDDLLCIGNVSTGLSNGEHVAGEFIARIVLCDVGTGKPKIKLYKVWADSAPIMKALQKA